ncbi:MAG: hypothetical protein SO169_08315 [Parabacteroides sp.]|nr:hypothetical protein [Parabacteroides sp.]
MADEATIQREYSPLQLIDDNYEKYIASLDDLLLASRDGIRHIQAWNLANRLNTSGYVKESVIEPTP